MRKILDTLKKHMRGLALAGAFGLLAAPLIAQGTVFIAQNGLPTAPSIYGVGDSLSGIYFGTGYAGFTKHVVAGSTATANLPVLSTCGTSPALATGSTDFAGKITVGTSASNACTLTFGSTYTTAPFCVVQNATTGAGANVYATTSATTIVWSSALADSTILIYHCVGAGTS